MESRGSSESRVVLVTGASQGLGRAIAVGFGAIGARVVVNYRTHADEADRTVKAVEDAGGSAFAYQADVRDAKNVAAMVSAAVDRWHRLDVLVCNAAASDDSLLLRLSDEAWDRVLATTLTGVFLCLQSAGAVMQAQGDGSVILIGSFSALQGRAGQAPYAAAKAGLLGLLRSVAPEWGPTNVRVSATRCAPQPSAAPTSRARLRRYVPAVTVARNRTSGGAKSRSSSSRTSTGRGSRATGSPRRARR